LEIFSTFQALRFIRNFCLAFSSWSFIFQVIITDLLKSFPGWTLEEFSVKKAKICFRILEENPQTFCLNQEKISFTHFQWENKCFSTERKALFRSLLINIDPQASWKAHWLSLNFVFAELTLAQVILKYGKICPLIQQDKICYHNALAHSKQKNLNSFAKLTKIH